MDKIKIYETATKKWGIHAQLLVAIEELAELQKAICKHINRDGPIQDLWEETADVEIMCEQIRHIFSNVQSGYHCPKHNIDEVKKQKLERLAKKLGITE